MGFSLNSLKLCKVLSQEWSGKNVLSLGNPFLAPWMMGQAGLESGLIRSVLKLGRKHQSVRLFQKGFRAASFKILDISSEEGADHIHDLNLPCRNDTLRSAFQAVIDLGTQEHIFNNQIFLENVFKMLCPGGVYVFAVPANGFLEHGFRQYSPTF